MSGHVYPRQPQPQIEPPLVAHRGRTSSGVEVIASVPFAEFWKMIGQARQMVFAALSGGPEAQRAIAAVQAAAENPDAPTHGYAVIMWYVLCHVRQEAEQFAQGGAGAGAQSQAGAPSGPQVAGIPQQQGGGGPQAGGQAWGVPGPPPSHVGGQVPMQQPMPQGGGGGGGAAARSYSRVKSSAPKAAAPAPVKTASRTAGGVRLETRVIRGGPAPAAPPAPAPVAASGEE